MKQVGVRNKLLIERKGLNDSRKWNSYSRYNKESKNQLMQRISELHQENFTLFLKLQQQDDRMQEMMHVAKWCQQTLSQIKGIRRR